MQYDRFGAEFHRYMSKLALKCLTSQNDDLRLNGRIAFIVPEDYPQLSQLLIDPLVNESVLTIVTRIIRDNPSTKEIFIPNLIKLLKSPPFKLYRSHTSVLLRLYNDFPSTVRENILNSYPQNSREDILK